MTKPINQLSLVIDEWASRRIDALTGRTNPRRLERAIDAEVSQAYRAIQSRIPVDTGLLKRILINRGQPAKTVEVQRGGGRIEIHVDHPFVRYRGDRMPRIKLRDAINRAIQRVLREL